MRMIALNLAVNFVQNLGRHGEFTRTTTGSESHVGNVEELRVDILRLDWSQSSVEDDCVEYTCKVTVLSLCFYVELNVNFDR